MNRRGFLKKATIGTTAGVMVPSLILAKAETVKAKNETPEGEAPKVAIDLGSISHIVIGGHKITAVDVLQLWRETGVLIYRSCDGLPPTVISGEIEIVDLSKP